MGGDILEERPREFKRADQESPRSEQRRPVLVFSLSYRAIRGLVIQCAPSTIGT
jgi:hypothetical protein